MKEMVTKIETSITQVEVLENNIKSYIQPSITVLSAQEITQFNPSVGGDGFGQAS